MRTFTNYLQELYKEYDFGIDVGPEGPPTQQSFPTNTQFSPSAMVQSKGAQVHETAEVLHILGGNPANHIFSAAGTTITERQRAAG